MDYGSIDIAWVVASAALAMVLQCGFCCFESGLVRSKNSIHIAMKNLIDFCLASTIFFTFGFGVMFGLSQAGWFGTNYFFLSGVESPGILAFFLIQLVFCATATTIVSGAVAERMRVYGYVIVVAVVAGLIYPFLGHWVWSTDSLGNPQGWLGQMGFIDFGGSTVIHGVGGWAALAGAMVLGPRIGRFDRGTPKTTGHSLPMSVMGVMLIWIGWIGLCAGCSLAYTDSIALVAVNLTMAAAFGGLVSLLMSWIFYRCSDVGKAMNGVIAGLVGITASCNIVMPAEAVLIGCAAAMISFVVSVILEKVRIDDVVGAFPAHACAGIWGTIAVAFFGSIAAFEPGVSRIEQLGIQAAGAGACFAWTFGIAYPTFWFANRFLKLRVGEEAERMGLNITEHNASTEILDLLHEIEASQDDESDQEIEADRHTEAGQIAALYRRMAGNAEKERQSAELVRKSEKRFRRIIDTANSAFIATDDHGRIQRWNVAAEKVFGWSYDQAVGAQIEALIVPDRVKPEFNFYQEVIENGQVGQHFEMTAVDKNGREFPAEVSASIVLADEEIALNIFLQDIGSRKELQEKLAQSQKMESIGQLAAGIAHEINTPTQFVSDNTRFLKDAFEDFQTVVDKLEALFEAEKNGDSTSAIVNEIERLIEEVDLEYLEEEIPVAIDQTLEGVDRVASIVKAMKLFSHPGSAVAEPIDLNEAIESTITVSRNEWKYVASLETDLDRSIPSIVCNRNGINQVLLNMIVNASHAISDRWGDDSENEGKILIKTGRMQDRVEIRVTDNGCGIDEEHRKKIFDPFFTTKEVGKGTGQGLAIAFRVIAEDHGGSIQIESELGRGTTFIIALPIAAATDKSRRRSQDVSNSDNNLARNPSNPSLPLEISPGNQPGQNT